MTSFVTSSIIDMAYKHWEKARKVYHQATQSVIDNKIILDDKTDREMISGKHAGSIPVVAASIRVKLKYEVDNVREAEKIQAKARLALDEAQNEIDRIRLLMRFEEVEVAEKQYH